ncbi:MAG: RHS repeat-associated core domain-containing protein [Myxococcaceae bacterium]
MKSLSWVRGLLLMTAALAAPQALAQCVRCSCTGTVYEELAPCLSACRPTLGCFVGICDPSDACTGGGSAGPGDSPPVCGPPPNDAGGGPGGSPGGAPGGAGGGPGGASSGPGGATPVVGDPIVLSNGASYERHLDARIVGAVDDIALWRMYISNDRSLLPPAGSPERALPKPFGASPSQPATARYWHNFYSLVSVGADGCVDYVRTRQGNTLDIGQNLCLTSPTGAWSVNGPTSRSARERLQWRGDGFLLVDADGGQQEYDAFVHMPQGTVYVLTRLVSSEGRPIARIEYAPPPSGDCPAGLDGSTPGAPYVSRITDGAGATLVFDYDRLQRPTGEVECVISRVSALDVGGTQTSVARYVYTESGGAPRPGLIARVEGFEETQSYAYSPTQYRMSVDGYTRVDHTYNASGQVTASRGGDENLTITPPGVISARCLPDAMCCAQPTVTRVTDNHAGRGDGSTSSATSYVDFTLVSDVPDSFTVRLERTEGSWPATRNQQQCVDIAVQKGVQDGRGHWTTFEVNSPSAAGVPASHLELSAVRRGALDVNGTGALTEERYGYEYGLNAEQRMSRAAEASVLAPGAEAETRWRYDESGRLKSVIRRGWTRVYDTGSGQWQTQERFIGTFHFTRAQCGDTSEDPLGRTREVHGPCWVDGPEAEDCASPSENPMPVTRFEFWPTDAASNAAGKLKMTTQLTDGAGQCEAPALRTEFLEYDTLGNPTRILEPSGAELRFEYRGTELVSSSVAGELTRYTRANGRVTSIQRPAGDFEVFCYRAGTNGNTCAGGSWADKLQWRAVAAGADGSGWTEKVVFTYWPDGSVKDETYWSNATGSPEKRRVLRHALDPQRRPTWDAFGEGAGGFATTRSFDGANNLTGVGHAFNNPSAFCGGVTNITEGKPFSQACAALHYDRANRLDSFTAFPGRGAPTRTVFGHDAQDNVNVIKQGCGPNDTVESCSQRAAQYQSDDFGNMVEATLPWTDDGSGGAGATRYAYDARGNVQHRQSPQMALGGESLRYTYDALGRLRKARRLSTRQGQGGELLFEFFYDTSEAPPADCPAPENTAGRLLAQIDSFGTTWFSYDAQGRLLAERRVRAGLQTCTGSAHDNPSTLYGHESGGRISTLTYPYGRTVRYSYGTGASASRVSAISVSTFDGTGWRMMGDLISHVVWEPYGGLRGYQVNHPGSGTPSAVEWMLGDNGTVRPPSGTCPAQPPNPATSNFTGLVRSLFVSTGEFTPGAGNGAILKKTYSWQADQTVQVNSCVLGATTARVETYGYDAMLRVTSASGTNGGAFQTRSYDYDTRSNRTSEQREDCRYTSTYDTAHPDWLTRQASGCSNALLAHRYTYDADGRVTQKLGPDDSRGGPASLIAFNPEDSGDSPQVATEHVFRSVGVEGAVYDYYQDAFGRRRFKAFPTAGVSEEYFHGRGEVLLLDQGNDSLTAPAYYVDDTYVWLGDRPVAIFRGKLDLGWTRLADDSSDCARNGEPAACGAYFPVVDMIGKPVLMLDTNRRVAGVGEYDVFGAFNSVSLNRETAHPYVAGTSTLADFTQPPATTQLDVRLRFALLDTAADARVSLVDGTSNAVLTTLSGAQLGARTTDWLSTGAGRSRVTFTASAAGESHVGAVLQGYEYRRYQIGAVPFWIPARFPGQRAEEETGLFDNWLRTYEPSTGRYLQAEPILRKPYYAPFVAMQAYTAPTYAYALNSPQRFIDPNGMSPITPPGAPSLQNLVGATWGWIGIFGGATVRFSFSWDAGPMIFIENHPLQPRGVSTTFGNVVCSSSPRMGPRTERHETQHVIQSNVLQDFYLPAHLLAQLYSAVTTGTYYQANPLEQGPYSSPPRPWP